MKGISIILVFVASWCVAAPPPGYPAAIEGTWSSGAAVGFNGHAVIPWDEGNGAYTFNVPSGTLDLFLLPVPDGDQLLLEMYLVSGSSSEGPVGEDWSDSIVANPFGRELGPDDPDYCVFIPTRVMNGLTEADAFQWRGELIMAGVLTGMGFYLVFWGVRNLAMEVRVFGRI